LDSYRRRRKFYRLKSGEFLRLEDNALSVLSELADGLRLSDKQLRGESIQVPLYRAGYIDSVLEQRGEDVQSTRDKLFKSLIRKLKSVRDSDYEVPAQMSGILRDYQKTGYRWLMTITDLGFGGILADDMGLGKTLQVITMLTAYKEAGQAARTLIVCPSSLVYNWESEIRHFSSSLDVLLVTGSAPERAQKLQTWMDHDVVVTSYDMLKRDIDLYEGMDFRFQVIDEAQYIKNSRTQAASSVKRVHARTRFALTGTPIENRLSELWSIFDYLMPDFLYNYTAFREELEQPIVELHDEIASARLRQMIRPFILRRMKKDVLKELPAKVERPVYAKLTDEQQKLYDANLMQLLQMLDGQSEAAYKKGKLEVLSALTRLRQVCCDPALIYENYRGGSAKLDTCLQLIDNAMAGGHRVLLFSQFTTMLDLIEKQLKKAHIDYYRLDGSTRSDERLQMVNSFNQSSVPVFLISLKAGGNGLNLTGADIVIHYDPWWNTAAQDQATDRSYRIGQDKNVMVYKLIARDTIEEKILALQDAKRALADEVISEELSGIAAFDKEELMAILR
jgi:SNF2 family DNA or RNA helicase